MTTTIDDTEGTITETVDPHHVVNVMQQAMYPLDQAEIRRLRGWLTAIGNLTDVEADERSWMVRDALAGKPAPTHARVSMTSNERRDELRRQLDTVVWDFVQRASLHDLEADRLMWIQVALRDGRLDDAAALLARETADPTHL